MRRLVVCLWLALVPAAGVAEESPVGLSRVETNDLKLYYPEGLGFLVPHAVRTFTNSLAFQRRTYGWVPSEPMIVLLQDTADYGNAIAYAAPHGFLVFDVGPLYNAFETFPVSERMYSLMNHEMVHEMSYDVSAEEDRWWRRMFFGKVPVQRQHPESLLWSYLTIPRFTAPRWYFEGGAAFMDTWMSGGLGRAQGGYDEMVFRAMVRDNAPFYDPLGVASYATQVDFQVGANAYLYGTRFFTWLAYKYSPEKVVAWYRRDEGSKRYWSDQFEHVFGMPVEQAWNDWIAFEKEFQRKNLAEVRKFPITPQRNLVGRATGSVSRTYFDEATGVLYGGFRYPGTLEHIGAIDTRDGSARSLVDIKRSMPHRVTSFAYDPKGGIVFYTDDNKGYLSFRDLKSVNTRTGEVRSLCENCRVGDVAFNPVDESLIGVRHENGFATLVRLPKPYDTWYRIHTFPYGVVPYDLDVSDDGRLLSGSVGEVNGDQFLRVWEIGRILAGDMKPLSQFDFGQATPESFTFSRDGRYLYGSSYYTGVSNIFRYEVATGEVEAVSNTETGLFRPVPLADGRLVVLSFTGSGFVPAIIEPRVIKDASAITFLGAQLAEAHPVVKKWQVPPPSTVDDEKIITARGPYVPLKSVALTSAYPVLQGYKDSVGIGYHVNFDDPLQYASLGITAAYTPTGDLPGNEQGHFEITGRYRFLTASLSWNKSDFYDLFGPTKRSRKGFAGKIGNLWELVNDEPRKLDAFAELAYYDKIDTLPNAQNVATAFTRLATAEAGLRYTDVQRSLGAVDDEKGLTWALIYKGSHIPGEYAPQLRGELDFGLPLPLGNSSVWLRSAAGAANGKRTSDIANFYFGGFGNNYVDNRSVKRYRNYDSFPGFEINEISALNFVRTTAEVNLPPYVFESAGTPSLYAHWLRPSVFVSGLWSDPGNAPLRRNYTSAGLQVDVRFSTLHWYEMTLSIGYAVGYREGRRVGDEWMISLKIL